MNCRVILLMLVITAQAHAQARIDSFRIYPDVRITLDIPVKKQNRDNILILFALPNGNTTEQTMGKKSGPGDDWHFDIQHIRAQTNFIRAHHSANITVAYLENNFKSWPLWKQKHPDYKNEIPHLIDTLLSLQPAGTRLFLNGHSGGGSFIFGYLEAVQKIPAVVERISFLDSNYGYDSTYTEKFRSWLKENKKATLTVFAYNDSVALYNNKPVVSAKGGTWYKSHQMMRDLGQDFPLSCLRNDSLIYFESKQRQLAFFFRTNPERKIFHTQQVELNGFIHSVLYRTRKENSDYAYFGPRAYTNLIDLCP